MRRIGRVESEYHSRKGGEENWVNSQILEGGGSGKRKKKKRGRAVAARKN